MDSNDKQISHDKSLLLFRVGPFKFCVPATDVEAIIEMPAFRSLPNAPPSIQGVFSHRGQVTTVINLRRKFGVGDHKNDTDGQLILARISIGLTGFRADEVMDIASSMEKDIIELTALKQSTRFDQVIVLDDQIIQCTEFELLYQAEDAPYRPESKPSTDKLSDDAPQPVVEKDAPQPGGGPGQTSTAAPESTDRSRGEPDEKTPPDAAAEKAAKASPEPLKLPGSSAFSLKNMASAHKMPPRKSPRQMGPLAGTKPAAWEKSTGGIASGKVVSHPSKETTPGEQNIGWTPPKKRSGAPIAWILVLAAVVIALYLFWPKAEENHQLQITSDVSVAPVTTPETAPSDYERQSATRAPSTPDRNRYVEGTAKSTGAEEPTEALPTVALEEETETGSESMVSEANEFETPEETIEGETPGVGIALESTAEPESSEEPVASEKFETAAASAEVNESEAPEEPIESEAPETGIAPEAADEPESSEEPVKSEAPEAGNTSTEAPAPPEDASRFLTIETEEFTLSVEPGPSETDESSVQPAAPPGAPPALTAPPPPTETEYIHIVVKGDTLWDIAEEYLGDPFQYPQLAEISRIRDPDWIYPGDRVRIIIKSTPEESQ